MSMFEVVFVALAIKLALVWVLRERTRIIRRVRLERLMYVGGASTLVTWSVSWLVIEDLAQSLGLLAAAALVELVVIAAEVPVWRWLGRLRWGQSVIFSAVTNTGAWLAVLALVALSER